MNLPNTCLGWDPNKTLGYSQTNCPQFASQTVQGLLGRVPFGSLTDGTTTIAIDDNTHQLWDDSRRTQIDMRFAKIFRFGRTRTDVGVDVQNLLNTNYGTAYTSAYGTLATATAPTVVSSSFLGPTAILTPRFVRLNFTLNF